MRKQHLAATTTLCLVLMPGLAACGGTSSGSGNGSSSGADPEGTTTITVYAAASLRSTFEELGETFEAAHDGVEVELAFAGSSDLVAQIQQGADADVFASADTANMDKLVADGLLATDPENFASNTLEIAVPPGNPANIATLADLTRDGVNLVTCAPQVPCGAAAAKVEGASGLDLKPVSEEQNVTDVLNKVVAGEADAGLVYVTDVIAAGDRVEGIEFPESAGALNTYPIATIRGSSSADLAQEFVDLVLGPTGQAVLAEAGFGEP